MRVSRIIVFSGPSIWSRNPVLEVLLEPVNVEINGPSWPAALATLQQWRSALPGPCSFLAPASPAEVICNLTLALQQSTGANVTQGWADLDSRQVSSPRMALEFDDERVARRALELALKMMEAACTSVTFSLTGAVEELREYAWEVGLGQTTGAIVAVARKLSIPSTRLDEENLVQLGYGARQRRTCAATTTGTGYLAELVSRDKLLTKQLLARLGIPVPKGLVVGPCDGPVHETVWRAACKIGLPVVVKPRDADYGHGVSLRL